MVTTNNDWLVHYKGLEAIAKRFEDQVEMHLRTHRTILTPFLTTTEQELLKKICGKRCNLVFDGGYNDAEKKRGCLSEFESDFEIVQLAATLNQYEKLTHRDCMGALFNCGCQRNQFGDIVLSDQKVVVFVSETIADFICENCTQIGRAKVRFQKDTSEIKKEENIVTVTRIVSSARLDSLVGACANISRNKAQQLIRGKNVQVNHLPLEDCSAICNNNTVLSIRGYGRFLFKEIVKETKKDKIVITIGIYK